MPTFIEKRLQSLHEIDEQIVKLTGSLSRVFETFSTKQSATTDCEVRTKMTDETKGVYQLLSYISILLRKEVRIVDENTGAHDKNEDSIMILPIPVDQKNSTLGEKKLRHEIEQLSKLIETEQVANALKRKGDGRDELLHGKNDSVISQAAGSASVKAQESKQAEMKTAEIAKGTESTGENFTTGTIEDEPRKAPTLEEVSVDHQNTQSTEPRIPETNETRLDELSLADIDMEPPSKPSPQTSEASGAPTDDSKDKFDDDGLF